MLKNLLCKISTNTYVWSIARAVIRNLPDPRYGAVGNDWDPPIKFTLRTQSNHHNPALQLRKTLRHSFVIYMRTELICGRNNGKRTQSIDVLRSSPPRHSG